MKKKKKVTDIDKVHEYYKELIEQKDKEIEELKKENIILLKLSLKQEDKNQEILDKLKRSVE